MGKISLDGYRKQCPRVGGVLAIALGGAITLAARRMSKPSCCRRPTLGALLVHQYEEYEDPGWFPGQFNHGVLKSDCPYTVRPQNELAMRCLAAGRTAKAIRLYKRTLADGERVLGAAHPKTKAVRKDLAAFTARLGG